MNTGKLFEDDFKRSVPDFCWINRYVDGSAAWDGAKNGGKARFQAANLCDFELLDDDTGHLALLELKSIGGPSLPFSDIRYSNLKKLCEAETGRRRLTAWFVINYRSVAVGGAKTRERRPVTVCVRAALVKAYMDAGERKSVPVAWALEHGTVLEARQLRVRWRYDITPLVDAMSGTGA